MNIVSGRPFCPLPSALAQSQAVVLGARCPARALPLPRITVVPALTRQPASRTLLPRPFALPRAGSFVGDQTGPWCPACWPTLVGAASA